MHTIAGVSTSVTAFVGTASRGPINQPTRIFSFADYQRNFGPTLDEARPMGHAVAHFFANGGSEAVIVRAANGAQPASLTLQYGTSANATDVLKLTARDQGAWANTALAGNLGLAVEVAQDGVANANDLFRLVLSSWALDPKTNQGVKAAEESYTNLSMSPKHPRYVLNALAGSQLVIPSIVGTPTPVAADAGCSKSKTLTLPLTVTPSTRNLTVSLDFGPAVDVSLFPTLTTGTANKSAATLKNDLIDGLTRAGLGSKITVDVTAGVITLKSATLATSGLDSAVTVTPGDTADATQILQLGVAWGGEEVSASAKFRPTPVTTDATKALFSNGMDGNAVGPTNIVPADHTTGMYALSQLQFPRFNLLCLPGVTSSDTPQIGDALSYCRDQRAFLIVDSPSGGFSAIPPSIGAFAAFGDHGALYYPRLQGTETAQGVARNLNLPTCGAVAGVIARTDSTRGVWKAPAGLGAGVVGIAGIYNPSPTTPIDDNLSGQLNPHGVNVLRSFPAAGLVVWGARTLKGDDALTSEFKYVPIRRLTDYIASSLYIGTAFAVFEPNDPVLWGQLRLAVGTFMRGLFRQGAFQQSPKRAESDSFFVLCDETVNPQSEIDLGRVNVLVGFAPLKPAEFVVITITQISNLEA